MLSNKAVEQIVDFRDLLYQIFHLCVVCNKACGVVCNKTVEGSE